jgi:anti-sigma factor RsiW
MNERDLTPSESAVLVLEEAENLIWALLDDHLEAAETTRLAKLLEENDAVRRRYIECVQLHVDLQDHFAAAGAKAEAAKGTAVLPNLITGGLSSSETPVTE